MVDIPTNVQQLLLCSKCDKLLQRGPVYLQHDGAAVCGPCQTSNNVQPALRCLVYEAAAQLLQFPCRYQENGCPSTVPFIAAGSTEFNHEDACEYRQYKCPMLGSNFCKWEGRRNEMQQHCLEEHPNCVLSNPAVITPDIHRSQMTNYIIPAFGLIFLLHNRVCESTAKLQYAVRLLAAPQLALNYSYAVTIQRGEVTYTRIRDVLPQELLVLQDHSALNLSTNELLLMLEDWEGASLTVQVKVREPRLETDEEQGTHGPQVGLRQTRAPKRRRVEQRKKQVAECPPWNVTCCNEGCNFQDIGEKKRDKHSIRFCTRRNKCFACKAALQVGWQWQHHYIECRWFKLIPVDSSFLVRLFSDWDWQRFLVETAAGHVLCECKCSENNFILRVYIPASSEQLYLHRCKVRLRCSSNTRTYTPDELYNRRRDWEVVCKDEEGNFFTNLELHVRVQVNKIE